MAITANPFEYPPAILPEEVQDLASGILDGWVNATLNTTKNARCRRFVEEEFGHPLTWVSFSQLRYLPR